MFGSPPIYSHRLHISAFFREKQNGNNVFSSVRAGDVNGYDSLLLSTTVVRGEGRETRRSLLRRVVLCNQQGEPFFSPFAQTFVGMVTLRKYVRNRMQGPREARKLVGTPPPPPTSFSPVPCCHSPLAALPMWAVARAQWRNQSIDLSRARYRSA